MFIKVFLIENPKILNRGSEIRCREHHHSTPVKVASPETREAGLTKQIQQPFKEIKVPCSLPFIGRAPIILRFGGMASRGGTEREGKIITERLET